MTTTLIIRDALTGGSETVNGATTEEAFRLVCAALARGLDDSRELAKYDLVLERRWMVETLVGGRERSVFLADEPMRFWTLLAATLTTDNVDFNTPEDWAEIDAEMSADA